MLGCRPPREKEPTTMPSPVSPSELPVLPVLIDGEWLASTAEAVREVRNPATLELLGRVSDCGSIDVDRAVSAARRAQLGWWRLPGVEKATLLHEVARRI